MNQSAIAQAMQQYQQLQQRPQQGIGGGQLPQGPVQPMTQQDQLSGVQQQFAQGLPAAQSVWGPGRDQLANQIEGGQQPNPLLQHPQVQQALQSVGQFLGKIGHPLASVFNQMHGLGGQGVGMPQSIINATGGNQPPAPYQNATNIGNLGGGAPVSMQQLGNAMGGK